MKTDSFEGYHITVGGGFGENRMICRQVIRGVAFESLGETLEGMLKGYLKGRSGPEESFHSFCNQRTIGQLQEAFSAE